MTKTYFLRLLVSITGIISTIVSLKASPPQPPFKTSQKTAGNQISLQKSLNFKELIGFFEKKYDIPQNLLVAIAKVESAVSPWAINAPGRSRIFHNKNAALNYIKSLQQQGVTNINVGYMQINLASHRRKFKNLEETLTPYYNIAYAAHLIKRLYLRYGSWETAVRYYHSFSSEHNVIYQQKVYNTWQKVSTSSNLQVPLRKKKTSRMVMSPVAALSKKAQ